MIVALTVANAPKIAVRVRVRTRVENGHPVSPSILPMIKNETPQSDMHLIMKPGGLAWPGWLSIAFVPLPRKDTQVYKI